MGKHYTEFIDIDRLLEKLLKCLQENFGNNLLGVYLYGSLVWGDFIPHSSDIDLLVVLRKKLSNKDFNNLDDIHKALITKYPKWHDRIEIAYLTKDSLKNFRNCISEIAVISPGEPFHFKKAGTDWLINYYLLLRKSIKIFGGDISEFIDPIPEEEFLQNVKEQALEWKNWVRYTKDSIGFQYYAVLTLCRAFYVFNNREQVSKTKAGEWVLETLPEFSTLIRKALEFRYGTLKKIIDKDKNYEDVKRFVYEIVEKMNNI